MVFTCRFYFVVVCIATLVVWSKSTPAPPMNENNEQESNLVELKQIVLTAKSVLVMIHSWLYMLAIYS